MPIFSFSRRLSLSILFAIAGFSFGIAKADDYQDVNRLIKAKQMPEALAKADQYLASKPRDPQMRFMKGVIQSETGKTSEAISTFTRLTEDYPELPEPYNNLAVIYANGGQFDKARSALEMAIRTNPSYATAHENLGDIYAKLASQSYAKALQLDSSNTAVAPKLALISELFSPAGNKTVSTPVPTTAPAPAPAPAPTVSPVVASTQPKVPTIVTASPNGTNQPNVASPVVVNALVGRDVEAAVANWAKAWGDRNMDAYLASYSKDFLPPTKQSHSAWAEERKTRIMGKTHISVKLSNLTTNVNGTVATVKFKQDYKADALSASSRKTLELVKSGDHWLITKEISG